jgi:hypothetical protein
MPHRARRFTWALLITVGACAQASAYDPRLPVLGDEPGALEKIQRFKAANAGQQALLTALAEAERAGFPTRDLIHRALLTQPEYAEAYAQYEATGDNADRWKVLLSRLPKEERFQRAHATYLLGRALLSRDELEPAAAALEAVRGRLRLETPWTDEATFYLAYIYARLPSRTGTGMAANQSRARQLLLALAGREGAAASYADVPERFQEAANWLLRELRGEGTGPLIELARRMDAIKRMLHKSETGDSTQGKQEQVVAELNRLIELMREKEQGGGGGGGGGGQQGGQKPGQGGQPGGNNQSGGPAQSSQLPGGQSRVGELADGRHSANSDEWGNLRDKDREEAIQFLREKFPTRYREIIERYYRALAEEDQ